MRGEGDEYERRKEGVMRNSGVTVGVLISRRGVLSRRTINARRALTDEKRRSGLMGSRRPHGGTSKLGNRR